MKYLPEDLNPRVTYFALCIVFVEYEAADTNTINYTAKGLCANNVELAVTLWVMPFCYRISLSFLLLIDTNV
jgi:hypothetical protein